MGRKERGKHYLGVALLCFVSHLDYGTSAQPLWKWKVWEVRTPHTQLWLLVCGIVLFIITVFYSSVE